MSLEFNPKLGVNAQNGGLFAAINTSWVHPVRKLESFELLFVKQGVLHLHEAQEHYDVYPGETLLLWPNRFHGGRAASSRGLKFYWVHFTMDACSNECPGTRLQAFQHVRIARSDQMTALFRQLVNDQELFGARSVTLNLLVTLMLCEVSRSGASAREQTGADSALAAKAKIVIQTKFADVVNTSTIAAELNCNPDYLGRIFRATYGKTITDMLHECRVRQASMMLADTGTNIGEIAQQCGFMDVAYFRRIFKRYQGMTPGVWRALYTRTHINHI